MTSISYFVRIADFYCTRYRMISYVNLKTWRIFYLFFSIKSRALEPLYVQAQRCCTDSARFRGITPGKEWAGGHLRIFHKQQWSNALHQRHRGTCNVVLVLLLQVYRCYRPCGRYLKLEKYRIHILYDILSTSLKSNIEE